MLACYVENFDRTSSEFGITTRVTKMYVYES